ncbi:mitochondrial sodium/calcium exchanger protein [Scaptodrosophila lebanonensis]|uniref:Mitochondrial sodium/calcium exchanger protein n=1 Tax=Drosophila lebanonensis TaxID=7225 RepID=A0A6J2U5R6_DROLE|nr:mitochondrial sodium/calcium exchanger protein [Scaptodrosophila lebanonensis]
MAETKMQAMEQILSRPRRHMSFLIGQYETQCYYSQEFLTNQSEICAFVKRTPSCSFYVYYMDYLKLIFCTLKLEWHTIFFAVAVLFILVEMCITYMIAKYFLLPNFLTLMSTAPISPYAFCFTCSCLLLHLPEYINVVMGCVYSRTYVASLVLARTQGDLMRCFSVGIMLLCVDGYRVNGLTLWGNMMFIIVGHFYLQIVVSKKYELFKRPDLPIEEMYMLNFRAQLFLFVLIVIFVVVLLVSYLRQRHKRKKPIKASASAVSLSENSIQDDPISDTEVQSVHESTELSAWQLWWDTVNGYKRMRDNNKTLAILLTPIYFSCACFVPVMDKERALHGWCKAVVCTAYITFPFLFIPFKPISVQWTMLVLSCWFVSFLILVATKARQCPKHLWFYSLTGVFMVTITTRFFTDEVDNLIWQIVSMQFHASPSLTNLIFFGIDDTLIVVVVLNHLLKTEMLDAAFGIVMSLATYSVYLAVPELVLHKCYNRDVFIMITPYTETCMVFTPILLVGSLLHISMCGYELRFSLFVYLLVFLISYVIFQWMSHLNWVHEMGTLHRITPPRESPKFWA